MKRVHVGQRFLHFTLTESVLQTNIGGGVLPPEVAFPDKSSEHRYPYPNRVYRNSSLHRECVTESPLQMVMHQHSPTKGSRGKPAVLEGDGSISIVPKPETKQH